MRMLPICDDRLMEMTLRFEIFPADMDAVVDFYTRVLRFVIAKDQRRDSQPYVSMKRGSVRVGASRRLMTDAYAARKPPTGVELVLEVDDIATEHDQVVATGWPLDEDLQHRPWGLIDFRVRDPAGYYLRLTSRTG